MEENVPGKFTKLAWSLPWLLRYPLWRAKESVQRLTQRSGPQHLIFVIANHFEPGYDPSGVILDLHTQRRVWKIGASRRASSAKRFATTTGLRFVIPTFIPPNNIIALS